MLWSTNWRALFWRGSPPSTMKILGYLGSRYPLPESWRPPQPTGRPLRLGRNKNSPSPRLGGMRDTTDTPGLILEWADRPPKCSLRSNSDLPAVRLLEGNGEEPTPARSADHFPVGLQAWAMVNGWALSGLTSLRRVRRIRPNASSRSLPPLGDRRDHGGATLWITNLPECFDNFSQPCGSETWD